MPGPLSLCHLQRLLPALLLVACACAHRTRAHRTRVPSFEGPYEAAPQEATFPAAPQSVPSTTVAPIMPDSAGPFQSGQATWYGDAFAGRKTASGERFNPADYTAAHRTLPFGTWVLVQRVSNGRQVRVRITDRGPFGSERRIIDLSKRAASDLDMVQTGVADVTLTIVRAQ
jgi:rare lipoprotein A